MYLKKCILGINVETVEELLKKCNIPKKRGGKKKQKVPSIYYVITFRGEGIQKKPIFAYF